jgi:hypothetical protein
MLHNASRTHHKFEEIKIVDDKKGVIDTFYFALICLNTLDYLIEKRIIAILES